MAIDTTEAMSPEKIKSLIKSELPILIQNDSEIQAFIMKLADQRFADKKQTKGRIEQLIEELKRDREEDRRKWTEAKQEFIRLHEEIMAIAKKHDRMVGAFGARWGLQSETTFRNALAGILTDDM